MEDWPGGLAVGSYNVNNLRYADDTTLIATSVADMAELQKRVKVESELLGLRLNFSKTKIMAISPDSVEEPLKIDGNKVESVSKLSFRGSPIIRDGGCNQESRHRLAIVRLAMTNLSKIWADRGITRTTKVRLVQALVFPIVWYAAETWTLIVTKLLLLRCGVGGACFASHGLCEGPMPAYWKKLKCLDGLCIPLISKCIAS